jgi:hypothetical protein
MNQSLAGKHMGLKDLLVEPRRWRTAVMRLILALILAVGLGLGTSLGNAWALTVQDLDLLDLGTLLPEFSINSTFIDVDDNTTVRGSISGAVYQWTSGGTDYFNYVLTVTPNYGGVEGLEVGPNITGLTGWGYSFSGARTAFGVGGSTYSIFDLFLFPTTQTVAWDIGDDVWDNSLSWAANNSIQFFLQSTEGPDGSGMYMIIDTFDAKAVSNAPIPGSHGVPEPATLLLLGSGLVGAMGMLRIRGRSKRSMP